MLRVFQCIIGTAVFCTLPAQAKNAIFNLGKMPKSAYAEYPVKGKVVSAYNWKDANGFNVILFSETGILSSKHEDGKSAFLYAYHYRIKDNKPLLIRKVQDFVKNCQVDLTLGFIQNAFTITDLDKDNIAEITFVYRLACRGDVSPSAMKLIMLENNKKYTLRGQMIYLAAPRSIEGSEDGKYTVDKSFTKAPAAFLDFARKHWDKHKSEDKLP